VSETSVTKAEIVSSESESLILVDSSDREIGYLDKSAAHDGNGVLHRAFSLFIFNADGQLLLQRRARGKRLWPGFWSNSCCSHPRKGEKMDQAVHRRLEQELGMNADLEFAYKFEYHAPFGSLGSEHELCWVYVGRTDAQPVINTTEIMDWVWIDPAELSRAISKEPERYTPWLKLEWERLSSEFADRLPLAG
jgi:isopentenyl-diphosphate delta-isomerase